MVTAVCTLEATASTREAMRSQLRPSFFLRMAFSAYTRAHSTFFCCRACGSRASSSRGRSRLVSTNKRFRPAPGKSAWEKVTKKKTHIPKIVITGPLDDSMSLRSADDLPQTQTIRELADLGPYRMHRQPSTVEAYRPCPEAARGPATITGTE
uniref:Uncharacterized protein n=1 Tax=Nothoprocta perdicaria TaxID=30464 RepID=A0A8C7E932_NOTPE